MTASPQTENNPSHFNPVVVGQVPEQRDHSAGYGSLEEGELQDAVVAVGMMASLSSIEQTDTTGTYPDADRRTSDIESVIFTFPDRRQQAATAIGSEVISTAITEDMTTRLPFTLTAEAEVSTEKYRLGTVSDVRKVAPEAYDLTGDDEPTAVYEVVVTDPYVEAYDKETRGEVQQTEVEAADYARERREAGAWQRKPGKAYVDENDEEQRKRAWGDPVSTKRFFGETTTSEALQVWRSEIIPSALALAYLTDPYINTVVHSKKQNLDVPIDDEARKWWALCTDAVAIRSRATVMDAIVSGYVDTYTANGNDKEDLRWASIACGTALPPMKAAVRNEISPKFTLIDFDEAAMSATEDLAEEIGFDGEIDKKSMNIFSPDAMSGLKDELEAAGELPQLVDMMGIFEYTGNNLGIDPVPFLKSGYDLVAPGGTLIFGQMRNDRPVEDFTMGVVAWPHVEMRSPKELMKMITAAGIPKEAVRMYMPSDGVYMVVAVDKPAA